MFRCGQAKRSLGEFESKCPQLRLDVQMWLCEVKS